VTVGTTGMHSVCVCEQHQNAKLFLSAVPGRHDYKDVLGILVCDLEDRKCMLRECEKCPGKEAIISHLTRIFDEADMDLADKVDYKQWLHTDRTILPISVYLSVTS